MSENVPEVGIGVMAALVLVILVSGAIGCLAQRVVERGSFMKGYFLGNRGLGVWAMALTATVQSGGTFMGFPSMVYSHGWIVSLWIGSYMIVPLTGFAVLGKRFAQLSRRTAAITVPDLFRGRFDSPSLGLVTSLLIMFFLSFMMVAQFKAGAIVMKLSMPGADTLALAEDATSPVDTAYIIGLAVFSATVIGYTLFGGFLASVWTDLFQSVLMLLGVMVLLYLAVPAAGGLERSTQAAIQQTGPEFAAGPGYIAPAEGETHSPRQFLPLSLACSMFVVWILGGVASPASMVRVMASKDTATLRRSIFVLSAYNLFIYIPLIMICISARQLIPSLPPSHSDEVVPRMALLTTGSLPGGSFLAGLILSAPFGAVMATVSSYLVVIASGIVRDVYQRFIRPDADDRQIRRVTYAVMLVIGTVAAVANLRPVQYLQALVIFCTSSGAASFFVPAIMAAYWRRATAAGALAAMLGGATTVLSLSALGWAEGWLFRQGWLSSLQTIGIDSGFRPYYLFGMEPVVWGLCVSATLGIGISLLTRPPREEIVSRLFDG